MGQPSKDYEPYVELAKNMMQKTQDTGFYGPPPELPPVEVVSQHEAGVTKTIMVTYNWIDRLIEWGQTYPMQSFVFCIFVLLILKLGYKVFNAIKNKLK